MMSQYVTYSIKDQIILKPQKKTLRTKNVDAVVNDAVVDLASNRNKSRNWKLD